MALYPDESGRVASSARVGSLFSGIGGLDLAMELAGIGTPAWFVERDKSCRDVLARHWPGVPIFEDVRAIEWESLPPADVLAGGYPCQPFSTAGRRKGTDDPRHLWPHYADAIRALRPRLAVLENVAGHLSLGWDRVLGDLAEIGYDVRWTCLRASDIGAPHRRERLFALAYPGGERFGQHPREPSAKKARPGARDIAGGDGTGASAPDADGLGCDGSATEQRAQGWGEFAGAIGRWERILGRDAPAPADDRGRLAPPFVEWMMGFPEGWTDGMSRTAALRALGNAVVPAQGAAAITELLS